MRYFEKSHTFSSYYQDWQVFFAAGVGLWFILVVGAVMIWWMKFDGYEKKIIQRKAEIKRELRRIELEHEGVIPPRRSRTSTVHRLPSSSSAGHPGSTSGVVTPLLSKNE
ncbi:Oidioi.mRNA.OKI2018_I69.chr2.g3982.t1.cds [Oikopleura dioica]|uniref:Oidioi.mRNA.OKI2018_I69.chr2.g3982.t1.cds n=1 Tax=Oikopleura dioica TaxID=34765 RepID=A0ABN7T057_OIKDI|nr:Oidioi.mRNA.OKI2018_I69.chr2.g3982.t1.cds [Oikopleura dioica]